MADTDLIFITNEPDRNLLERFRVLIKDTQFFDVLVGYFFTSGFHALYKSLEKTKKIRILIGISTNPKTTQLIHQSKQQDLQFSYAETKEHFSDLIADVGIFLFWHKISGFKNLGDHYQDSRYNILGVGFC